MDNAFKDLLAPYYDGELDPGMARRVTEHLAACPACQQEIEALAGLSAWLTAAELPPPAAAEAEAFWRRLQPGLGPQARPRQVWRSWLPGLVLVILRSLVALASMAAALSWLLRLAAAATSNPLSTPLWPGIALPDMPLRLGGPIWWALQWGAELVAGLVAQAWPSAAAFGPPTGNFGSLTLVGFGLGLLYLAWLVVWYSQRRAETVTIERRIIT